MAGLRQNYYAALSKRKKKKKASRLYGWIRRFGAPTSAPATQPHYRRAADTIIEEANGNLLWANGMDKMLRFTPYSGLLETAGIIRPGAAMSLSGQGTGSLVGTFYAYCRFVDRDGNYSSLSPVSNAFTPSVTVAAITGASNTSPIVITAAGHGLANNQIAKVAGIQGNTAANGIWVAGSITSTTFTLLNLDGSYSLANGTYLSGGTLSTGVAQVRYDKVPIPTEAKVVRRQLLRNKDGEASVFYIDVDTTDLTSQTFLSSTDSLGLAGPVSLFTTAGVTLVDMTPPPNFKKHICQNSGRVFGTGIEPYAEGAIAITSGSATVTGIGTEWGQLTFPGRLLTIAGGNLVYTIQSVESPTSLTLATPYTGTTDPFAYYSITPASPFPTTNPNTERRTIYWTQPSAPEGWPLNFQETLAEDPGAGEFTGLMSYGPYLYVLAQNRIYQFSWVDDPASDSINTTAAHRGCINNRCWTQTEDAVFMLDQRGCHIFAGNDDSPIGTKEVQDLFRPRQAGPYKIDWTKARNFHAIFDPGECVVRWFVTMSGSNIPQHALCYQVRLRRWWIEEYPFRVGASCLGRLNGKPQVFLGSDNKRIFALSTSTLDGLDPSTGTVRGNVTSAGVDWFADSTASFPVANLVGNSVVIMRGVGKGQRRRIVSVSGSTIHVDQPWTTSLSATTPGASMYQIGGISFKWKSSWKKFTPSGGKATRAAHVNYAPASSTMGFGLRAFADFSDTAVTWSQQADLMATHGMYLASGDPTTDLTIDPTQANGYAFQRFDNFREEYTDAPRYLAVEINGVSNADAFTIRGVRLDGVS